LLLVHPQALAAPAPEVIVQEPIVVKELTIKEKIYLAADKWHVSGDQMYNTIKCESGFNEKAWNKSDPKGGAHGVAQFLSPTFYKYAEEMKIEKPDIHSTDQQLDVMGYMFSKKQESQWTCWRQLYQ
jgi:hypothetical protein